MILSTYPITTSSTQSQVPELRSTLASQVKERWWNCETSLPSFGPVYSSSEKRRREAELSACLSELNRELSQRPAIEKKTLSEPDARLDRLTGLASRFAKAAFSLEDRHLQALQSYGFTEAFQDFVRQARRFDPDLSPADIYQALRNAGSMNFFQLLLGLPVEVTPAVLAYSLLYPYSDNFLDSPKISLSDKATFSARFYQRLQGQWIRPANAHEGKMWDLVGMIETQFGRQQYPQVYDSLLAIYEAQTNSLQMQHPGASPYEVDLLSLGIIKGGTSVLADGYLVAGDLTPSQCEFMYHYGAFTQLLDDLEDVMSDLRAGIQTIFSQTARHWPLDAITNRTIHFGQHFLDLLDDFDRPGLEPLKEVLRMSLAPLMIDAASQFPRLYTQPYLAQLEPHYPFRFSFMRQTRKRLERRKLGLESLVELLV